MALNPKLNVYVVTLNPKDKDSHPTFRDLFKEKYHETAAISDEELKKMFFQEFLNKVGKTEFRKDTGSKKVIGVSEYDDKAGTSSLHPLFTRDVIEGIIDGGQYGVLRAYADVDDKAQKTSLGTNNAVLDKFYICLCTPFNSAFGFLLLQSYTEATIQEPVKSFVVDLLRCEERYYGIHIEPFVPKKFVERFKKESKIRMFTYRSKVGVSDILRDNQLLLKEQSFDVEITIRPLEQDFLPGTEQALTLAEQLGAKRFDDVSLSDYSDCSVYIQDKKDRRTHYDVSNEIHSIRPTIYLADEGITVDETTGQPDFNEIKVFTLSLLEEVKREYNGNEEIEEL